MWNIIYPDHSFSVVQDGEYFVATKIEEGKPPKMEIKSKSMVGVLNHLCGSLEKLDVDLYIKKPR